MITVDELLKTAPSLGKRNYERNRRLTAPSDHINGQKNCCVSSYRLGLRKMSSNGCGPIAVYNALLYAGHKPDFNAISLGIESYALKFGGIFGTDPDKMEDFFLKCRIAAIKAKDHEDFCKVIGAVKAGIVCYWVTAPRRSFLHFAAVTSNENGFLVFNRYSNRKKPSAVSSIDKFCSKEQFVCGFFIS